LGTLSGSIALIVSWSGVYCSCIECNVQNAWMLGVVVVGGYLYPPTWLGGIYIPQPPNGRWGWLLSMSAPDSPVRCHVTQPLGFGSNRPLVPLSSCGTGQSGATPDTVRCASDFCSDFWRALFTHYSHVRVDRWCTGQSGEL
jgi:hypothetical protein